MKKFFPVIALICIGFIVFTGQKYPDDASHTLAFDRSAGYTPYFPRELNVVQRTTPIYLNSQSGFFMLAPNYRIYPHTATQSEVEAYVNPILPGKIMVGWNSFGPSFYGTGFGLSTNGGVNWSGNYTLPGLAANSGDPSVVVSSNGTIYMNAIGSNSSQQVVTWSMDNGITWVPYVIASSISSSIADKNHMTIDDKSGSPYYNYLYLSYTDFSSTSRPLKFARSTNGGVNWDASQLISSTLGWAFQGVNLHTGPSGECYMIWSTRSTASPYQEKYIGFAKSTNGGTNFQLVNEVAVPVNGIRGNLKPSNIRVNSFPWMAVDKTGGPYNGYIYVTCPSKQLAPAGNDPDIIFARSTNGGLNWGSPIRINDDPINNGKDQWFSNVCVDQYGGINIIFYDSRNFTNNDSAEVYVARSVNGGVNFTNIKVSDHKFYPKPISGLAGGYQGDYIGIAASGNKIFPFWADDYSGAYQVWTSPIDLGPSISHTPLTNTEQISGSRVVNCVITPAGSPISSGATKLFFTKNPSIFTDSVVMTNTGGNNWTGNLTLSGAGTYRYYIRTKDDMNRYATAPDGAPALYYSFIASTDTVKPVITHTPLPDWPRANWPANVSATVTDNIGVDSVWVKWYKNNTGTGIKHFKLNFASGNNYSANFNSTQADVAVNDSIFYRVFARDNSSGHNMDSTALYKFKITSVVTITIGTGTSTESYPIDRYYNYMRWQAIYLRSEIGISGTITKIRFYQSNAMSGVTSGPTQIYFKLVSDETMVSGNWDVTGHTTVYTGTINNLSAPGWLEIVLSSPFVFNMSANQNLLISINRDYQAYISSYPSYNYTSTSSVYRSRRNRSDTGAPTSLTQSYNRANIQMDLNTVMGTESQPISTIPNKYDLRQNYPNPFNPVTKISFDLPKQEFVKLRIFDVLGREVKVLVNEMKIPGAYSVEFNASELSSGVYFYKLETDGFSDIKKMMLIK